MNSFLITGRMGFFNHLFGGKKRIAQEIARDEKKRLALWNEHLANFEIRENLSKQFNFKTVDQAVQNFAATDKLLGKIEELISRELITVAREEKTDEEIVADLEKLKSTRELEKLASTIVSAKQKQAVLLELFHEIFAVLQAELHLIRLIRKKPSNVKDLLLKLFRMIFFQEALLYKVFQEKSFFDENKPIHAYIAKIARAILLQEEIKEEMETDEEVFAKKMVQAMGNEESRRGYRMLAQDMFYELAEMAGAPLPEEEDFNEALKRLDAFVKNDTLLYRIVKKLRPKYDDQKIRIVIIAFRKAYTLGHFLEFEQFFW